MKFVFVAIVMAAASATVERNIDLERPIEDSFVWMTASDNGGTTRKVEVKRINKLISPGVFNMRRWDLI